MAVSPTAMTRMLRSLPVERRQSRTFQAIAYALGLEMDLLYQHISEFTAQLFARTATWTLDEWEVRVGLSIQPTWPVGERQDRVVAHLKSFGTPTIARIKEVALSFQNGEIDVVQDHAAYALLLIFSGTHGVPANEVEFQAAMRRLIHAHLAITYAYNYTTWSELTNQNLTFTALTALNHTFDTLSTAY